MKSTTSFRRGDKNKNDLERKGNGEGSWKPAPQALRQDFLPPWEPISLLKMHLDVAEARPTEEKLWV